MKKTVVVCSGNMNRSPAVEAYVKHFAREKGINIEIRSAGIEDPNDGLAFYGMPSTRSRAGKYLLERGISEIEEHVSRFLTPEMVEWADILLAVDRNTEARILSVYPQARPKVTRISQCLKGKYPDMGERLEYWKEHIEPMSRELFELLAGN
ncbi:MAG: hypothetical protein HYW26_04385 [Candidatus Aenigmarchaeota archaeon]|nr:hypothetical protein [Candidatus Aenigmarchaeota archaeon]